jgi:hypothetical protein
VLFTPFDFGLGVTAQRLRYQMSTLDAGIKYKGFALEGEYYMRKLDYFEVRAPASCPTSGTAASSCRPRR